MPTYAQRRGVDITGTVIEGGTNEPIEQATVRLLNAKDSTMVGGVATGRNGSFTLKNIKNGNYVLNISFIGFETLYKAIQVTGKNNPMQLGKLTLSDASIQLGEAVVIGKAPEVTFRNDTMEFNAESYKLTEGSMLEDLLKKMPGVEIDSDGKITVNGKEIKKVLVDGKEFFSDDPKVASKNLPSKMIDKVQVLDKLSDMAKMTGFDDGEEETVINLTVKPGMKQGWFGNAYAGYGSEDRYEGNFMVNRFVNNDQFTIMGGLNNTNNMGFSDLSSSMFQGMGRGGRGAGNGITTSGNIGLNMNKEFNSKLTINGNLRYSHSENDAYSKSNRQNILPDDSTSYYNETNNNHSRSDNVAADIRMEWTPDTLTRVIFRPNFSYSNSHRRENGYFNTLSGDMDTVNIGESRYLSDGEGYNVGATLEFSRKLNSRGRVLSGSLSGRLSDSYNEGLNYSNTEYRLLAAGENNDLVDQQFRYDNNSFNYRVYLSWVEPIGHNNFIQATYSIRQNKQESLKNSYTREEGSEEYNVLDTAYSQSYRNNYINQQVSLAFKSVREKFDYTIGLTVDPSHSTSETFVGDTVNNLSVRFQNFKPEQQSAFMTMLNFNYVVNDIVTKSAYIENTGRQMTTYDNVNGNFSGNVRVMYNAPFKNRKFSFNTMTMGSYANSNGFINSEKNTNKNIVLQERAGINFRSDYLDLGVNGNIRYNATRNSLQGQSELNTFNYGVGGNTTIYLPWDFKIESDISWSTNSGYSDGFEQNEILWNASASKSFLKGKTATLRFKIYDILQQRSNISRSVTASYTQDSEYNTLGSYFMVHFIYRFNVFKGGGGEGGRRGPGGRGFPPMGPPRF